MGSSTFPAPSAESKTSYRTSLTSGTTWNVPAGVNYVNVIAYGAGGGGAGWNSSSTSADWIDNATGGSVRTGSISVTPGGTVSYSIGAGGSGSTNNTNNGSNGGTTNFGSISAPGGSGGVIPNSSGITGPVGESANNHGGPAYNSSGAPLGGAGGSGQVDVEYWL